MGFRKKQVSAWSSEALLMGVAKRGCWFENLPRVVCIAR